METPLPSDLADICTQQLVRHSQCHDELDYFFSQLSDAELSLIDSAPDADLSLIDSAFRNQPAPTPNQPHPRSQQ